MNSRITHYLRLKYTFLCVNYFVIRWLRFLNFANFAFEIDPSNLLVGHSVTLYRIFKLNFEGVFLDPLGLSERYFVGSF